MPYGVDIVFYDMFRMKNKCDDPFGGTTASTQWCVHNIYYVDNSDINQK